MDTQDNAAPQGDSAPLVDASLEGVLARRMATKQEQDKASPGAAEEADAPGAAEPPAEPVEETEPGDEPETPEGDAPAEPEEEPKAHGNMRTVMEDGTVTTVGELKKLAAKYQEIERQTPELLTARQEIETRQAHVAQQHQQLEQVLPLVQRILEQSIPDMPPEQMFEDDPLEAQRLERLHLKAIRDRDKLESDVQQLQMQAAQAYIQEQQGQLLRMRPDLREREKAEAFYQRLVSGAKSVGLTEAQVARTHDASVINAFYTLLERSERLEKIEDSRAKLPDKTKGAVPVQQPGARPAPGAQQAAQIKQLEQRARRSGSIDDVHALHMARLSSPKR